jgi:excisionase family DNA binding protein
VPKTGTRLLHLDAAPVILAFTTTEAAAALRISRTALYALLRTGSITSYRVGKSQRVSLAALTDYQRRMEEEEAERGSIQGGRWAL